MKTHCPRVHALVERDSTQPHGFGKPEAIVDIRTPVSGGENGLVYREMSNLQHQTFVT